MATVNSCSQMYTRNPQCDPMTETVWVMSRLPLGVRPVPRFKHVLPQIREPLPEHERHWIPVSDPPLASFQRLTTKQRQIFHSHSASRCEEWSTLRQMLPTEGYVQKMPRRHWGTAMAVPHVISSTIPDKLPIVNSEMTTFVDEVHTIDKAFRLYTSR